MASSVIDVVTSDPPKRVLCSHCEKMLSPVLEKPAKKVATEHNIVLLSSDKNGKTIIPDETIIEVFEQLLPKDDKKGKLFF
jgi:hypothetical protein